jgi:hypothetical protein
MVYTCRALQMKGWWESNINVWFPVMYFQKLNCYFQNRIIMFCLPVPTLIYLWQIYIFPRSVCLFCCREICGLILGIYKSLTDKWNVEIGTEATQFPEKEYIYSIFLAVWWWSLLFIWQPSWKNYTFLCPLTPAECNGNVRITNRQCAANILLPFTSIMRPWFLAPCSTMHTLHGARNHLEPPICCTKMK